MSHAKWRPYCPSLIWLKSLEESFLKKFFFVRSEVPTLYVGVFAGDCLRWAVLQKAVKHQSIDGNIILKKTVISEMMIMYNVFPKLKKFSENEN